MKQTSKQASSATRYYKCSGCGSTDKTFEHGLALDEPVYCIKASCTTKKASGKKTTVKRTAMEFDAARTQKIASGQLFFNCPNCLATQTRTSKSIRRVDEMLQRQQDVINRRR